MTKKNTKEVKEKKVNLNKKEKKKKQEKNVVNFSLTEVIIITFMTAVVVCVLSGLIVYNNYGKIASKYEENNDTGLVEFIETYNHILDSYVEKIDKNKLVDYAIEGMFNYLEDSHTDYLDDEESLSLQDKLNGEYTGVGIEMIDSTEGLYITNVFDSSPAQKAGLEIGDKIIEVNGISVEGKGGSYVADLMKDKNGEFEITVFRNEENIKIKVKTGHVTITSVHSDIFEEEIGYLKIDTFSATTFEQFESKLKDLEKEKIKSLIIDVRDNTGGYLNSAYEIADLFIEKGKIIYQLKDKSGKIEAHKAKTSDKRNYDIIILTNGSSASASEILAAALKDSYGAKLVGTQTFGKGSVQETETLSSGNMIKYTTAYWLTPLGVCVEEQGINPDVEVIQNNKTDIDEQLDEAINLLKK